MHIDERRWISAQKILDATEHEHPNGGTGSPFAPDEWTEEAACKDHDPVHYFGTEDRPRLTPRQLAQVRRVCAGCPVRIQCLQHALSEPEHHGVWAGTTARERARIHDLIGRGHVTFVQVITDFREHRTHLYERLELHPRYWLQVGFDLEIGD